MGKKKKKAEKKLAKKADKKKLSKDGKKKKKTKKSVEVEFKFCPCCSKHCPLSKPKCSKGKKLSSSAALKRASE